MITVIVVANTMSHCWCYHHGTVTARVHPVLLLNDSHWPMDQANQLEPQIGLTGSYIIQLLAPFTTTQPECW